MLAEQLLTFANDIIEEYRIYSILDHIAEVISIIERRPSLSDASYNAMAIPLRNEAKKIIQQTRFSTYPSEWQRIIESSKFSNFLPARAADIIIHSLPDDRNLAPLSPEIKLYQLNSSRALDIVRNFLPFVQNFHLSPVDIPNNELGVIIEIPRKLFDNEAESFSNIIKKFSDFISILSEIVTNKRLAPRILYISTSDPTTIFSTIPEIAALLLSVYECMLDISVKTLEVAKALGLLRATGYDTSSTPDIEEHRMQASIESLLGKYQDSPDKTRLPELQNELLMRTHELLPRIKGGARLSLAATTEEKTITQIVGRAEEAEMLTKKTKIVQTLEITLDGIADDPTLQIEHQEQPPAQIEHQEQPPA